MSVYIERAAISGFQVVLRGPREELQRIDDIILEHNKSPLSLSGPPRCWVKSANPVHNYSGDEEMPEITLFVYGSSMREAIWHTMQFLAANFPDIEFPTICPNCDSSSANMIAMGSTNSRKDDCAEYWCTNCGFVWYGKMTGGGDETDS